VLYYALDGVTGAGAPDPTTRQALLTAFATNQLANYTALLTANYTATELQATCVNHLNEVNPLTYTVSLAVDQDGPLGGEQDGAANVGIIGFQLSPDVVDAPPGLRLPKRSYIAYGPLPSSMIANDGSTLWVSPGRGEMEEALTSPLAVLDGDALPIRIGVPNEVGVGAIGTVQSVIFRPFSSDRKSRRRRPNGR